MLACPQEPETMANVLIVDDDEMDRLSQSRMVEETGLKDAPEASGDDHWGVGL